MVTRIFIEDDYESFSDFHDREWLQVKFEQTKNSHLHDLVSRFAASWWGQARSFFLPWLFIGSIADLIASNPLSRNPSTQELWDEYKKIDGFKAALWKLAENSYCGLYYAYESLVVETINLGSKEQKRVTDRDFLDLVRDHFGEPVANRLWNDQSVSATRESRNCLIHNDGRATAKLKKMQGKPMIDDGQILISASDTRALHELLKPKVDELISFELKRIGS